MIIFLENRQLSRDHSSLNTRTGLIPWSPKTTQQTPSFWSHYLQLDLQKAISLLCLENCLK
jgi:hypothetical protein